MSQGPPLALLFWKGFFTLLAVVDFILGLHAVLKVPRVYCEPLALSKHHVTLETVSN